MLDNLNPQFIGQTMNHNLLTTCYQYLYAFSFMEDLSANSLATFLVCGQLGFKNDFCNYKNRPVGGSVRTLHLLDKQPRNICTPQYSAIALKYYPAF